MARSARDITESPPTPRPPETGSPVRVCFQKAPLEKIDRWRRTQPDLPSRAEAIRRLVETGLAGATPMLRPSSKAASKVSDMAAQQIDKLADSSATDEERQARKRRLLKGPKEFRDIRRDRPKPKR